MAEKLLPPEPLDEQSAANRLECLGNVTRLAIFRSLVQAGPSGLPVGALQRELAVPASTLSHHVGHLVRCDLVRQEREGRVLRCHANYGLMNALVAFLQHNCCARDNCC